MSFAAMALYLGRACLYAAALGLPLLLLGRAFGIAVTPGRVGLVLSTGFVIFLGLSPFPDPASLDCSQTEGLVQLTPFGFLEPYQRLWQAGRPLQVWLTNLGIVSPVMNVAFFALVGAFLAGQCQRAWGAVLFACLLTAFIEFSQVSALYGIYACPYRHFDVDDLILNIFGVVLGFVVLRGILSRRRGKTRL